MRVNGAFEVGENDLEHITGQTPVPCSQLVKSLGEFSHTTCRGRKKTKGQLVGWLKLMVSNRPKITILEIAGKVGRLRGQGWSGVG